MGLVEDKLLIVILSSVHHAGLKGKGDSSWLDACNTWTSSVARFGVWLCVCSASRCACAAPRVPVSVEADELAVELGERSGHGRHFLPLTPPTVEHLNKLPKKTRINEHTLDHLKRFRSRNHLSSRPTNFCLSIFLTHPSSSLYTYTFLPYHCLTITLCVFTINIC